MTRRVTIKDIAAEAGVSVTLVSFVMSNQASGKDNYRVNKETAKRVLEVAERFNYKPNNAARALRMGKTSTVGVIVPDISNMFFANIIRHIEDYCFKRNYTVIFGSSDENPNKLENLIGIFLDKGVDGLLVVPCEGADEAICAVAKRGTPIVLLDRDVPNHSFDSVMLNNVEAGILATEVLIHQGCKKIDLVAWNTAVTNLRDREFGYHKAMERAGLADNCFVHRMDFHHDERMSDVVKAIRERKTDGVVFINNTLSILGVKEIMSAGLSIPDDVRLSTFDYVEDLVMYNTDISFIRQPIELLGANAVDLLINIVESEEKPKSNTKIVLAPELIISNKIK